MSVAQLHSEAARQKRISQEMREAMLRRFTNPDADWQLEQFWVAHVWTGTEWMLAGFRRRRNRRKPQTMNKFFSKVRRQFGLDKQAPVMLMDLGMARRRMAQSDQAWRFREPQFQQRKAKMEQRTPKPVGKTTKRRAPVKAKRFHKIETKFIVIGRNPWDRKAGYLYLGPLHAEAKRAAQHEAKRTFPVWQNLLIIAASELSKPLRMQMARGKKVQAGMTRIVWPEVAPTFDELWEKFARKQVDVEPLRIAVLEAWMADGQPWLTLGWLRKQVRRLRTPSKVVWKDGAFQCTVCKEVGRKPYAIKHGSPRCVPTPIEESEACAADAKDHAKRVADRKRKRLVRNAEAKKIAKRRHAQKLAARKRRRILRKNSKPSSVPLAKRLRSFLKTVKRKSGIATKRSASTSPKRTGISNASKRAKSTRRKSKR